LRIANIWVGERGEPSPRPAPRPSPSRLREGGPFGEVRLGALRMRLRIPDYNHFAKRIPTPSLLGETSELVRQRFF